MSCGRGKAHLGVPKLINCLILFSSRHLHGILHVRRRRSLRNVLLLSEIQNVPALFCLCLVFNYGFSERRLSIQRVQLRHRLVQQFVINSIKILDDLITNVLHGSYRTFLTRLPRGITGVDHRISQAFQALRVEILLIAKNNRKLLEQKK